MDKVIEQSLKELDYEVFSAVLDGQDFVPQHRERIIIVGFDKKRYGNDIHFSFDYSIPEKKLVSVILFRRSMTTSTF